MNFLNLRHVILTSIIVILAGCQSGRDAPKTEKPAEFIGGPIVSTPLPAQASQGLLPGAQMPTTKVALLLPLSGSQANIGNAMLNAAQMSLFENAPDHLELISEDTKSNPENAAKQAEKVIREGAKVIVGPLFANEAAAVAKVAAQYQVPVLTFSNNRTATAPNVYFLGFMPDQQINRLFTVAKEKGINAVAILLPSNEAGNVLRTQAEQAASASGIQLVALEPYAPGSTDMKKQAAKIKQAGVQAVLIPEGGQQLRLMISSLLTHEVDPSRVKFMGTGQWDSPDVYGDKSLNGSWFAASPISLRQAFMKKYAGSYGQQPPRLATLAYDTISMISLLTRSRDAQTAFSSQTMTQSRGYQGIDGIFRLNGDGSVQRGLAVYEISDAQGLMVVSPAPEGF